MYVGISREEWMMLVVVIGLVIAAEAFNTAIEIDMDTLLKKQALKTECPIAVIMREGKILVGHRHYKKTTWKDLSTWTFPGGRPNNGETIEEGLRREVSEETGITNMKIIDVIASVPGEKEGDTVFIFFCSINQESKCTEPEKFSEWRWIAPGEYVNGALNFFNPKVHGVVSKYLQSTL